MPEPDIDPNEEGREPDISLSDFPKEYQDLVTTSRLVLPELKRCEHDYAYTNKAHNIKCRESQAVIRFTNAVKALDALK